MPSVLVQDRLLHNRRVVVTALLAGAAVCLFALHQKLIDAAALAQHAVGHGRDGVPMPPAFYLGLPYRVVDPMFAPPQWPHAALLALAVVECALLAALYRALRERVVSPAERGVLAVAAFAMMFLALDARSVLGFDLYAYAGLAKLGVSHAYATPLAPFPGDFGAINRIWGLPMLPSPYGPLWVWLAHAVVGGARSLSDALQLLRICALVPFVAIAAILRHRGIAFAAVFALDPSMQILYVSNGHNDLAGVVLLLLALLVAAATPLAAMALTVAAGLVKLPLAGCALLVFAGRGSLARRIAWVAVTLALVIAGSLLLGGPEYARELFVRLGYDNAQHGLSTLTASVVRALVFALAVSASLVVFVRRRIWRSASWTFAALSSTIYPWYLASGLPYALLERGTLAMFLVLFPAFAALLEFAFPHLGLGQLTMLGVVVACVVQLARRQLHPIDEPSPDAASS